MIPTDPIDGACVTRHTSSVLLLRCDSHKQHLANVNGKVHTNPTLGHTSSTPTKAVLSTSGAGLGADPHDRSTACNRRSRIKWQIDDAAARIEVRIIP
jgi:hypothetical protein